MTTQTDNAHRLIGAAEFVADRLTAWADTADIVLRNCPEDEREQWRNQRDNYQDLASRLNEGLEMAR